MKLQELLKFIDVDTKVQICTMDTYKDGYYLYFTFVNNSSLNALSNDILNYDVYELTCSSDYIIKVKITEKDYREDN